MFFVSRNYRRLLSPENWKFSTRQRQSFRRFPCNIFRKKVESGIQLISSSLSNVSLKFGFWDKYAMISSLKKTWRQLIMMMIMITGLSVCPFILDQSNNLCRDRGKGINDKIAVNTPFDYYHHHFQLAAYWIKAINKTITASPSP